MYTLSKYHTECWYTHYPNSILTANVHIIQRVYYLLMYPVSKQHINTLRPRQNGRRFADDTFKRIFLNENVSIKISLKFVPKGPINNIPALVQIMAWRRPGDKPLSEPMMVSLLTHMCVTRPQWVNCWCTHYRSSILSADVHTIQTIY